MQHRLHIRNQTHMVEWPNNNGGMLQAKAFRKNHPEFKRRKIRKIIQFYPQVVPCGEIMEWT